MGDLQAVVFKLDEQMFGVETSQVQEIIRYQDIQMVPGMPEFMEGMINLRGRVIPIINLHKRFRLGQLRVANETKIIITDIENRYIGFVVDDVTEIIKFLEQDIEEAPDIIYNQMNRYLKCIAKRDEKIISIFDLSKILSENEVDKVVEKIK
ncbi:MAG: chemotaxis protein CheW [Acetivibrionales bacterium]|jgi:purine-binding chemotaxis protein CheW